MNRLIEYGLPFSDALIERTGWVLIHSLWQFALLASLVAVVLQAMRRNTCEARYAVLVGAIALAIMFPIVTWVWQPHSLFVVTSAPTNGQGEQESLDLAASAFEDPVDGEAGSDETHFNAPTVNELVGPAASVSPVPAADHEPVLSNQVNVIHDSVLAPPPSTWTEQAAEMLHPWFSWIVGAWVMGVSLCLLRPLLGWLALRRLKRVGVSTVSNEVLASLARVSEQMGLRRSVSVLASHLVQVPMVIGYFRPVILLPISLLTDFPAAQLDSILAHELAHIRRHDFVVNMLQVFMETLFFYHPALWWLSHRIRVEREHCCDDLVVKTMDNRIEYGRALIAVEELRGRSTVLSLAPPMDRYSSVSGEFPGIRARQPVSQFGLRCA